MRRMARSTVNLRRNGELVRVWMQAAKPRDSIESGGRAKYGCDCQKYILDILESALAGKFVNCMCQCEIEG